MYLDGSRFYFTLPPDTLLDDKQIIATVQQWLEVFVVGMNLCPFAKRELVKQRPTYCP